MHMTTLQKIMLAFVALVSLEICCTGMFLFHSMNSFKMFYSWAALIQYIFNIFVKKFTAHIRVLADGAST